jgi:23S rRNA (cytosine1962-C5)-methyltransferase
MFINRLRKKFKHLRRWAERQALTAYRVYDRDLPDYPFAVDWYDAHVHIAEYPRRRAIREGLAETQREEVIAAVQEVLEVPRARIYVKTHVPMKWGEEQYERSATRGERFTVQENKLRFWVNLGPYLDTGLFLDHRNTRSRVRSEAQGKRMLNLFAYTGSFTVYAAAGGAASTLTVDLSNTYLEWASENLALNGLSGPTHRLQQADVLDWIHEAAREKARYDLVVLDPPSFSTSKRMVKRFEVQRDHAMLLAGVRALMSKGGTLYFSTNFLGFSPAPRAFEGFAVEELTPRSLPQDFEQRNIHRCWRLVAA